MEHFQCAKATDSLPSPKSINIKLEWQKPELDPSPIEPQQDPYSAKDRCQKVEPAGWENTIAGGRTWTWSRTSWDTGSGASKATRCCSPTATDVTAETPDSFTSTVAASSSSRRTFACSWAYHYSWSLSSFVEDSVATPLAWIVFFSLYWSTVLLVSILVSWFSARLVRLAQ